MIYLYWYFGVGGGIIGVIYGVHLLKREDRYLFASYDSDRSKLYCFILNYIIPPLFAVAIWPVAVAIAVYDRIWNKQAEQIEFGIKCEHLLERMTVQEIESREVVTDPLGAAPELPFGHLNAAWKTFINDHASSGELWSFTARWQPYQWSKELRSGYVVVRDGVPGPHFLTVRKDVTDEVVDDGSASQARVHDTPG